MFGEYSFGETVLCFEMLDFAIGGSSQHSDFAGFIDVST